MEKQQKETLSKKSQRWTLVTQLWLLSGGLVLNGLVIGGVSFWNSQSLIGQLSDMADVQLPAVRNMTLADMMHDGIRANAFRALILGSSKDSKEIQEIRSESEEFAKNIREHLSSLDHLPLRAKTKSAIQAALPAVEDYVKVAGEVVQAALSGQSELGRKKLPDLQSRFEALEKELEALGELISDDAKHSFEMSKALEKRAQYLGLGILLLGLLLGIMGSFGIIRNLQRTLKEIISQLSGESLHVNSTAAQLNVTSVGLSQSVLQQASAIHETSASLEEIHQLSRKTAENASLLEKVSEESTRSAEKGQKSIQQLLTTMEVIRSSNADVIEQIERGNQQIAEMIKVVSEIGAKTKVIHEIVFQTKLLSFNASVEAARAGEHGKGFSVVAEEVGNLAQLSGNAAKEISDVLHSSLSRVESILAENKKQVEALVEDGKSKLELGTQVTEQCRNSLNDMVKQGEQVRDVISSISVSIRDQGQSIEEISKAVHSMNEATTQHSSTSKETSSMSEGLLSQAQVLQEIVTHLEELVIEKTSAKAS